MKSAAAKLCFAVVVVSSSLAMMAQTIVTVAGGGPNNMKATAANLPAPVAVVYDRAGDLYIASGLRAFKVDTIGTLTIVAGNGVQGPDFGNGGPATEAEFGQPMGVALDPAGNVYLVDNSGGQASVRRVDVGTGTITQFVSIADGPLAMQSDAAGNLYVSGNVVVYKVGTSGTVTKVAGGSPICAGAIDAFGDGCPATQAFIDKPHGVAFDSAGNMFIADFGNCLVRRVDATSGVITRFAGSTCFAPAGDGGPATSAGMGPVGGIAIDPSNNLFICDHSNFVIRKVTAGIISTYAGDGQQPFAGDGGLATKAQLSCSGMATDSVGNLAIADSFNNRVRLVTASTQIISTYAGSGDVFFSGDAGPAVDASMQTPQFVSTDVNGNILVSEATIDNRVRRVDLHGVVTTVAGVGEVNGVASTAPAGIGGPAISANLAPAGVVADAAGDIFIAAGNVLRVDAATGLISLYAGAGPGATGNCPTQTDKFGDGCLATNVVLGANGLALDNSGNLLIADSGIGLIRRVNATTQIITAVAGNGTNGFSGDGGLATSAQLNNPWLATADSTGNVFIADQGNARIRRVDAKTGVITTVAGNGTAGFSGDGGPATSAELGHALGVVVDSGGNLFIADGNLRVRRVDAATQVISTYAGIGTFDLSGDGGPAVNAALAGAPNSIALDTCGNLLVQSAQRIRRIGDTPEVAAAAGSASNLNFPGQLIGTSSSQQSFTVKDTGCIGLTVASVTLADTTNFAVGGNCSGTTVSPNKTCNVNVTFKPTTARLLSTTATIVTNDSKSPLIVPIAGNGTDFSIAPAASGATSATVAAGQTASYSLQVVPVNGFSGNVALTCSGAPDKAVCSVSPNSASIAGASAALSVTITTTATTSSGVISYPPIPPAGLPALFPLAALIGLGTLAATRLTRWKPRLGSAFACIFMIVALANCGGGGGGSPTTTTIAGTPKGSFTLTVSGTSGGITRTTNLTLTVN